LKKKLHFASFLSPTPTKNPWSMQRKIQIYKEEEKGLQVILKKRIAERE
jgi:hypothetical protein